MPTVSDDRRALDLLSSGRVPDEIKPQVMSKLGINDDDLRAWTLSATLPQDQSKQVRNKVFEKISNVRPIAKPEAISGSQFVRFIAKNFLDQDIETQKKFFRKMGFDAKTDDSGNLYAYDPDTKRRVAFDPKTADIWDVTDILTDVLEGVGVGAATVAAATAGGKIGGTLGAAGGPIGAVIGAGAGAVGGGLLGAYGAGAGAETIRESVATGLGAREEFSPERIDEAGKYAALFAPLDLIGMGTAKHGAKQASKRAAGQVDKSIANKLRESASILGIDLLPGQWSDNRMVQKLLASLRSSTGKIGGIKIRELDKKNDKIIEGLLSKLIEPSTDITKYQAGDAFGSVAKDTLKNKLAPAISVYQKYDEIFKTTSLNDALGPGQKGLLTIAKKQGKERAGWLETRLADTLDNFRDRVAGEDEEYLKGTLFWLENRIKSAKNINDIKVLRTNIRDRAARNQNDPIWQYMNNVVNSDLKEVRSDAIKLLAKKNPSLGETAVKELEMADSIYAQSARELENLIGSKKGGLKPGVSSALDNFLETTAEIPRVEKIISTKDPKRILRASQEYPEAFELLRDGYKNALFDKMSKYISKEGLNITGVIRELDKLPPESLAVLYGDHSEKIVDAIRTYYQTLPKHINPPETTVYSEFLKNFSLVGWPISQLNSLVQERALKGLLSTDEQLSQLIGRKIQSSVKYGRPLLYPTAREENQKIEQPRLIPYGSMK